MTDQEKVIANAKKAYNTGITRSIPWRKKQLHALLQFLEENEESIYGALKKDLHKSNFEAFLMEINMIRTEIIGALQHMDEWTKPDYPKVSGLEKLNKMYIRKEPFGVCIIIGAWNFPIMLVLQPLVGAIAAGNCAVIKPSEIALNCAELLQNLLPKYLHKECFPIVLTDGPGSAKMLQNNQFDLIFYTGGANVAKLIMSAASKFLTPVILELGGKNPCIVDRNCDLMIAAKRIASLTLTNAGQICLAPDHVLSDEKIHDELVENLKIAIREFYGDNPKESESLGRIVNERHVERLKKLLPSGKAVIGGEVDEENKYIAPTVLVDVAEDSPIMMEEVFGPILPILKVKNIDEAIASVNRREKPLALYVFTKDQEVIDRVLDSTSSGGVAINDCAMQFNEFLPFGGVGNSGMGNYHGKYTFEAFSHKRSCFQTKLPEMIMKIRYPPYSDKKLQMIKRHVMKKLPKNHAFSYLLKLVKLSVVGVLLAFLYQQWMIPQN